MSHSKISTASSIVRCCTLILLWCGTSALAQTCDTSSPGFDWAHRESTIAECVTSGAYLTGEIAGDDLDLAAASSSNVIRLNTSIDYEFDLSKFANLCISRAMLDVLCARHRELLVDSAGMCRLEGVYVPPSDEEMASHWLHAANLVRWDICSPFAIRGLQNPVQISGSVYSFLSGEYGPTRVIESLELSDLQISDSMILRDLVVLGDVRILRVEVGFKALLIDVVILGDLQISESSIEALTIVNTIVSGGVEFSGNDVRRQDYDDFAFRSVIASENTVACDEVYSTTLDEEFYLRLCGQ